MDKKEIQTEQSKKTTDEYHKNSKIDKNKFKKTKQINENEQSDNVDSQKIVTEHSIETQKNEQNRQNKTKIEIAQNEGQKHRAE